MLSTNCPWCLQSNPLPSAGAVFCKHCGHRADVPQHRCDCLLCLKLPDALPEIPTREEAELPEIPVPFEFMAVEGTLPSRMEQPDIKQHVQVVGRTLREPTVEVTIFPSRVVIVLGDQRNPAAWVHVILSEEIIMEWHRAQVLADDATEDVDPIE